MPWDIVQDDKTGKFCVYKVGNKKPLHCYPNQTDAEKYAAALYAHERSLHEFSFIHAVERGLIADFIAGLKNFFFPQPKTEDLGPNTDIVERWVLGEGGESKQNCPKCMEFANMGFQPLGFFPKQRAESTFCGADCTCRFEYSDGNEYDIDRISRWDEWESWYAMTTRSSQSTNDLTDDEAAFILATYAANPNKTFFVYRTQEDKYRWFAWPACTAFVNRDHEIDSMALFDNFIDHIERTQEWPYLTFFHQGEKFKMGDADFVARDGVAYLVSGLFDDTKIAREAIQGILRSEDHYWGTSINYKPIGKPYYINEQDKLIPVYYNGIHKEVSLLPEQAASSVFTAFPILKE